MLGADSQPTSRANRTNYQLLREGDEYPHGITRILVRQYIASWDSMGDLHCHAFLLDTNFLVTAQLCDLLQAIQEIY